MEPTPPAYQSVGQVRDRVIQQLTEAFASDAITVDELEARLDRVYGAGTIPEVEAIVADLRLVAPTAVAPRPPAGRAAPAPLSARTMRPGADAGAAPIHERFVAVFSGSSRRGSWVVPEHFEVFALCSDAYIDLTAATLSTPVVEIEVRAKLAHVSIVVPAGFRVENRVGAFMANVESDPFFDRAPVAADAPVVRLTGFALMSHVEVLAGAKDPSPR